jgi:hypothetical protein
MAGKLRGKSLDYLFSIGGPRHKFGARLLTEELVYKINMQIKVVTIKKNVPYMHKHNINWWDSINSLP